MKNFLFFVAILLSGFCSIFPAGAALPNEAERDAAFSLNGAWEACAVSADQLASASTSMEPSQSLANWLPVEIPGHLQIQHPDYDKSFASPPVELYRKTFRLPANWQNRRIVLQFDGVLSAFQVWVDGKIAGRCGVPLLPVCFDVTGALRGEADHGIVVQLSPSETPEPNRLTGIFRDVTLLALPDCFVDHIQISTELEEKTSSAKLHVQAALPVIRTATDFSNVSLSLELFDPQSASLAQTTITWFEKKGDFYQGQAIIPVSKPVYWTAETPVLYRLAAVLTVPNQPEHRISQPVGIRQFVAKNGVLALNGVPVHWRGIDYRDSHPTAGYALRETHWRSDLQQMKDANINTIRLTARPPHPKLLQLCDELGFYAIYDLPPSEGTSAETVADALIRRDGGHPSIAAWSLAGFASSGVLLEEAANRVKTLDSSRLLLAAGVSDPTSPASLDLLAPLDPALKALEELSSQKRPVIALAQSPGSDNRIEGVEDFQRLARSQKNLAGGTINRFTDDFWSRPAAKGALSDSGILTADRAPKLAYWQTRKMYSPVWIEESVASVKPGKQTIELTLHNNFDFTNLRDFSGQWFLLRDGKPILARPLLVNLDPGKSMEVAAAIAVPDDLAGSDYSLQYQFVSRSEKIIYEHAVRLLPSDWEKNFLMRLRDLKWDEGWNVTADAMRAEIKHREFSFIIQLATPGWFMRTQDRNVRLIAGGPFIRLGNSISSASDAALPSRINHLWIDAKKMEKIGRNIELHTHMIESATPSADDPVQADVDFLSSPFGYVDVRFSIQSPENRPAQEIGLGFLVPSTLSEISWQGLGPYPSYPGQSALSIWGLFSFNSFTKMNSGNRSGVVLVAMRDERESGLGIMLFDGDVSLEPSAEGTLVTINSAVAGLGNGSRPTLYPLSSGQKSGANFTAFRLIPLVRDKYPEAFEWLRTKNK